MQFLCLKSEKDYLFLIILLFQQTKTKISIKLIKIYHFSHMKAMHFFSSDFWLQISKWIFFFGSHFDLHISYGFLGWSRHHHSCFAAPSLVECWR